MLPQRFRRPPVVALVLAFGVASAAGGGGPPGDWPDLGEVAGVVTLDGAPVENAVVQFAPETGRPSQSRTDADGRYELISIRDDPGTVVGAHTVRITKEAEGLDLSEPGTTGGETIPARYNANTELQVAVEPGPNTHNFPLKSD